MDDCRLSIADLGTVQKLAPRSCPLANRPSNLRIARELAAIGLLDASADLGNLPFLEVNVCCESLSECVGPRLSRGMRQTIKMVQQSRVNVNANRFHHSMLLSKQWPGASAGPNSAI
jgi:hypothetical protein